MADPAIITINRNKNFHSIQVESEASAGKKVNSVDIKFAADLTIQGSSSFSTTGAGVKLDIKVFNIEIEGSFGQKFEFLNGANLWTTTAKADAFLKRADVMLADAEKTLIAMEQKATELNSGVTTVKKSETSVRTKGITAVM